MPGEGCPEGLLGILARFFLEFSFMDKARL